MGIGKMVVGAGLTIGAGYAGFKALENMDSNSIRECGESIKNTVGKLGQSVMNSDIAQDLTEKINGTKYGPKILGAVDSVGNAFSGGFDKLVDAVAASKSDAEQGSTTFGGALAERLSGLVADGADYIAEHIPTASDIGTAGGNAFVDRLHSRSTEPEATPEDQGVDFDV